MERLIVFVVHESEAGEGVDGPAGGRAGPRWADRIRPWLPPVISTWYVRCATRDAYNHRLRLVQYARQHGIKPTARAFATTAPTVRKWLSRYKQHGPSGLRELSRAQHHCPHKTSSAIEEQVLALRKKLPTFGAARLKREFDLLPSHMAIHRIWREHGLIRKRRKKYQRKQDLAAVKATWRLFQQISADTKDLCDIPQFWPQAQQEC